MIRSTLFFLAVGLTTSLSAQNKTERAQVNWGEERNEKKHGDFQSVLHRTGDRVYVKVQRPKGARGFSIWIQLLDQDLNMLKEQEIPIKINKEFELGT